MNRESGEVSVRVIERRRPSAGVIVMSFVALAALNACDEPAPPVDVDGTGSVEGLVFFDVDEDRIFDPSDGDEALAGVRVMVQNRGTGQTFSMATGESDSDGRFSVTGVPLGTHDLFIDTLTVPQEVSICQNPLRVSVHLDETTFQQVQGRPGCLITIVQVQEEAEAGDFVVVRGVVTAYPGQFDEGDAAIQDETGGIWLFDAALEGQGLAVGDVVELGGTVNLDVQALQLTGVAIREVIPGVGAPDPMEVTTGEIAAAGDARDPLQNLLVTVRAAELTSGFTSGGSRNASIDDGTGSTLLRVESGISDSGDAILSTVGMEVGKCYDITGIVGAFFGDAELFPRSVDDVEEVPCS